MISRRSFLAGAAATACAAVTHAAHGAPQRPHIVYLLADDLGYGDIRALNPDGKIYTPHLDRIAREGVRYTDAHSGAAMCTPTRYGILTGRHFWRSEKERQGRQGYGQALIPPSRMTVAKLLQAHGYKTVGIGKWHLGLDFATTDGRPQTPETIDYTGTITNGPTHLGFDHYYGLPASLDMAPYIYIDDERVVDAPTEHTPGREGSPFWREGPMAPGFDHQDVLPILTGHLVEAIVTHDTTQPLFLYGAFTAPHAPFYPSAQWSGKSRLNEYADFVMQLDFSVGEILNALDKAGMADDTLLIFASDNGVTPKAELDDFGHQSSYRFRGEKFDVFEGGHRIPLLARWPGRVTPGRECKHLVGLTDLMATVADLLEVELPADAGEDSVSILMTLIDDDADPPRKDLVTQAGDGSLAIRDGKWKLQFCPGSGGRSAPTNAAAKEAGLPPVQLYDLEKDIAETTNLQAEHPGLVADLTARMRRYIDDGRSTPGPAQQNDATVVFP